MASPGFPLNKETMISGTVGAGASVVALSMPLLWFLNTFFVSKADIAQYYLTKSEMQNIREWDRKELYNRLDKLEAVIEGRLARIEVAVDRASSRQDRRMTH